MHQDVLVLVLDLVLAFDLDHEIEPEHEPG
jgi:hypothetical protein